MSRPVDLLVLLSLLAPGYAMANMACDADAPLTIISATDDGFYEETHGPENAIDGNLDPDSRWSNQSLGDPKTLLLI